MKKLFLVVSLLLLTTFCHSQSFDKVVKATLIKYIDGRWVDSESTYPEGMFIIMKGSEIKITNEGESKYVTYGEYKKTSYNDYVCYSWNCYDKNGRDCIFMMKMPYDGKGMVLMFIYSSRNIGFEYVTE